MREKPAGMRPIFQVFNQFSGNARLQPNYTAIPPPQYNNINVGSITEEKKRGKMGFLDSIVRGLNEFFAPKKAQKKELQGTNLKKSAALQIREELKAFPKRGRLPGEELGEEFGEAPDVSGGIERQPMLQVAEEFGDIGERKDAGIFFERRKKGTRKPRMKKRRGKFGRGMRKPAHGKPRGKSAVRGPSARRLHAGRGVPARRAQAGRGAAEVIQAEGYGLSAAKRRVLEKEMEKYKSVVRRLRRDVRQLRQEISTQKVQPHEALGGVQNLYGEIKSQGTDIDRDIKNTKSLMDFLENSFLTRKIDERAFREKMQEYNEKLHLLSIQKKDLDSQKNELRVTSEKIPTKTPVTLDIIARTKDLESLIARHEAAIERIEGTRGALREMPAQTVIIAQPRQVYAQLPEAGQRKPWSFFGFGQKPLEGAEQPPAEKYPEAPGEQPDTGTAEPQPAKHAEEMKSPAAPAKTGGASKKIAQKQPAAFGGRKPARILPPAPAAKSAGAAEKYFPRFKESELGTPSLTAKPRPASSKAKPVMQEAEEPQKQKAPLRFFGKPDKPRTDTERVDDFIAQSVGPGTSLERVTELNRKIGDLMQKYDISEEALEARLAIARQESKGDIIDSMNRLVGLIEAERRQGEQKTERIETAMRFTEATAVQEEAKGVETEIRKNVIVTDFDKVYSMVQGSGRIGVNEISRQLGIPKGKVEDCLNVLRREKQVEVIYPAFGDAVAETMDYRIRAELEKLKKKKEQAMKGEIK